MTTTAIVQLITAITALIGAITGIMSVIRIQLVHTATNSIVTRLLIEGKALARAEGVAAGLKEGKEVRDASSPLPPQ